MRRDEFQIGKEFECGGKQWRCTDVGTRVIVAICLSVVDLSLVSTEGRPVAGNDWFKGPPYAVAEEVFDENDMPGCEEIVADRTQVVL